VRLDLDPAAYTATLKEGIRFQQKLTLKPGHYRLRLGVSDMDGNRIGILRHAHYDRPSATFTQ
jgi:hypothetical protein